MVEQVVLYGAGKETITIRADDPSLSVETQRWEVWGSVAAFAAQEQAKYAGDLTPPGPGDREAAVE